MAPVATPTSQAELEEWISGMDGKTLAASLKDGSFKNTLAGYVAKATETTQAEIKEQAQVVLAEMLQDKKTAKTLNLSPLDQGPQTKYRPIRNEKAIGAALDGTFTDIGELVTAFLNNGRNDRQLSPEIQAKVDKVLAYQERVPSEGGFLVPEEFRAELLRLSLETSIVRPRARVVPMGSSTLSFPSVDSTSNASSVFGGIVVYRTAEGANLTETSATFGRVKLEATKQTAYAEVTNELMRDAAGGFTMYLNELMPEALAFYEDYDYLAGSGVGAPLGAVASTNPAVVTVTAESGQGAGTIVWENIIKMYARMLPSSLARAVWVANINTLPQLATMALTVGTAGSAIWLSNGVDGPPVTILGRPVLFTEKVPSVGTQGDISFVDFGYYLIGDRQQMSLESSEHYKFASDKTAFRVIQRNDGRPWLQSAITPKQGTDTLSPFVQLSSTRT